MLQSASKICPGNSSSYLMPPAAGWGCSELELRSKSTCAQQDFDFLLPTLCSTRQVCISDHTVSYIVTFNYEAFPLLTSLLAPQGDESPRNPSWFAALEVGQEGRAAPCRILAPAKGLLPGRFSLSAQPSICNSYTHWFPLATTNRGQVRHRTALISYKLKLIIIIMKGCMNAKFASFAVVFTKDRLAR